eukprot:UN30550
MLRDPDATDQDVEKETESNMEQGASAFDDVEIKPKYKDEKHTLAELQKQMDEALKQMEEDYNDQVVQIESIVHKMNDEAKSKRRKERKLPPNPDWKDNLGLIFDYQDQELPIGGRMRGTKEFLTGEKLTQSSTKINTAAFIIQQVRHEDEKVVDSYIKSHAPDGFINKYSVTFDINFSIRPKTGKIGLFQTLRQSLEGTFSPKDGESIYVSSDGSIGTMAKQGTKENMGFKTQMARI